MTVPVAIDLPESFNLADALLDRHIREGRGSNPAIYYLDEIWTYADVSNLANRIGNVLKSLDVRIEDRVIILEHDSPQFAASFFGVVKIGAVAVPVSTILTADDYRHLFNDCRARVALVSAALRPVVESIRGDLEFLDHVIVVGSAPEVERASPVLDCAPTCKDDAAFWQYSSGTTGRPKGVIHLQHDMMYSAELFARGILGICDRDRTFSVARLFFGYGLGNGLCFPFCAGGSTILLPERPTARHIMDIVQRHRPSIFFGVPTSYAAMLEVENPDIHAWEQVRTCVSSGEALPVPVWERWHSRFGHEIIDSLGSTEALHVFITNSPGDTVPGSLGRVVPGYDAMVVDDDLREVPPGQIGNLLIRGDSIAAGYWNRHQAAKRTFIGDALLTGDKCYRDEAGRFWFSGRSDDMIKAGGIWVSPAEVESALAGHPAVLEAGVVGHTDENGLVKPRAFVVLRDGYQPSDRLAEEIKLFVKGTIAPYKFPRWIDFVSGLPRTPTGKLKRFVLRQLDLETKKVGVGSLPTQM